MTDRIINFHGMLLTVIVLIFTAIPSHAQMIGSGNDAQKKHTAYVQTNLVSDGTVSAVTTDSNLKNPWGIAFFQGASPFWISDNNGGVSTLYDGKGTPFPSAKPLVVKIPLPNGPTGGAPTGVVANIFAGNGAFLTPTTSAASLFIFATEDGTIIAWNQSLADPTEAVIARDNSGAGAVYKGLAIGTDSQNAPQLYATNFRSGKIDVFDTSFTPVTLGSTAFSDPQLPKHFAPFGIQNIGGKLWVTYALQDQAKHDPVNKPAHGIVDVFDTDGNMIQRFAQRGHLNSPWGITVAPGTFGEFANDVLIGNFGDGRINAYSAGGQFEGQLKDSNGTPIAEGSLWALTFGGALNSSANTLYFTTGLTKEMNGLFGAINPM
jgi:uncharacterized protein (TIGR03118 family)